MKLAALAMMIAVYPAWGQIAQSHPEYCGIPGNVNPPIPDVSATTGQGGNATTLYVGRDGAARAVPLVMGPLPSSLLEIRQVCPLRSGRFVVFGDYGRGGGRGPHR